MYRGYKFYGLVSGVVTNNQDPLKMGRCKLEIPAILDRGEESAWALPCVLFKHQQTPFPKGTPVWVMFQGGDIDCPVYFGTWYLEKALPSPTEMTGLYIYSSAGKVLKIVNNELTATFDKINLAGTTAVARVGDTVEVTVGDHGVCQGVITSGSAKVTCG